MDRYFEDWIVGERFESGSLTVEEEAVLAFAREYDPQPFHRDHESAKRTPIGRLIASGWQTCGYTMRLVVDSGVFGEVGAIGMGVDELRWLRPVFPGDTLRVTGEVLDVRASSSKPRGVVRFKLTTLNQNGEPVLSQTTMIQVPRRPENAPAQS